MAGFVWRGVLVSQPVLVVVWSTTTDHPAATATMLLQRSCPATLLLPSCYYSATALLPCYCHRATTALLLCLPATALSPSGPAAATALLPATAAATGTSMSSPPTLLLRYCYCYCPATLAG